ncbi:MAG: hypothetical protein VXZ64_03340, partial [Candidatus Thermoplasmatota archaeon]|nr:hypothetical protein [Candidatus Thermoplasmatota archaeon]
GSNQPEEGQGGLLHVLPVHRSMMERSAFERAGRTVINDGLNQPIMARPSKAHRPKRRWIGVELGPRFTSRQDIEQALADLFPVKVRLMDAVPAAKRDHDVGLAILGVTLAVAPTVRSVLEDASTWLDHGMRGVTTSGKIRLVRERLGLPRPPRR